MYYDQEAEEEDRHCYAEIRLLSKVMYVFCGPTLTLDTLFMMQ